MPPLLSSRPAGLQVVIADVVPALFGVGVGVLLITTKEGYLIASVLGIAGGFFAGLEHRSAAEGAVRGFIGGLLFGICIVAVHVISGSKEKADIPDPEAALVLITTFFGILLGALGGWVRSRRLARDADANRAAADGQA